MTALTPGIAGISRIAYALPAQQRSLRATSSAFTGFIVARGDRTAQA